MRDDSVTKDASANKALMEAWRGELFGEAIARLGLKMWPDAEIYREAIEQVERVESLMESALFDALAPGIRREAAITEAENRAVAICNRIGSWRALATESIALIPVAIERFIEISDVASAANQPLVKLLIEHEEALLEFMTSYAMRRPLPRANPLQIVEEHLSLYLATRACNRDEGCEP